MVRAHRSIIRRAKKIDAGRIANEAEDYLYGYGMYKRDLQGASGLVGVSRLKTSIKRIDDLEKEILRLEDKMDRLMEKRSVEAAKLEEYLVGNREVLEEYLEPEEMRDFWG